MSLDLSSRETCLAIGNFVREHTTFMPKMSGHELGQCLYKQNADSYMARYENAEPAPWCNDLTTDITYTRAEVYGNARHILYGNCYVGDEEHEIQNFAFCEAMLQALIASPGDTQTYDPIIGRYLDTSKMQGYVDAYVVDVNDTGRHAIDLHSGKRTKQVNYTLLAHDNFQDEWKLMNVAQARVSISDSRPPLTIGQINDAVAFVKSEEQRKHNEAEAKRKAADDAFSQFVSYIDSHMPKNTQAVIVAERVGNACNPLEDYYGANTYETVVIGWSTHTRNLFPEMRKAAKRYAPVAHLADLPKDMEHKRSYGSKRAYLKECSNEFADGWMVYKVNLFGYGAKYVPNGATICDALLGKAAPVTNTSNNEQPNTEPRIVFNEALQGIEIHFSGKPNEEVLASLNVSAFRYHRKKKVWYAKHNPENLCVAETITAKPKPNCKPEGLKHINSIKELLV
ncbi:hypothetical protein [Alteromonas stellipolaris]|uniref:hypothetical protein n=1 Tax=Alteromonas stellipolaris TaxID=233316 RepID=UPI001E115DDA|nr:hypothetical protein [Alteromonas stellipolaris]MBZ2163193.1 hypothetical protein [Alteromonas stellipolaris]